MDINYLYSIVNLYLKKENDDKRANLSLVKDNDQIKFSINMDKDDIDVTSFIVSYDELFKKNNIKFLIQNYKNKTIVIEEKFHNKVYSILLNNGRRLTFENFSVIELNDIRNMIYAIDLKKEEIRIDFLDDEDIDNKYYYTLKPTGFASFKTILVIAVCFLVVFIVSLWLFNIFLR